ncbi:MAG: hypothetical protein WCW13_00630 [archaeon]|jgi:mevalonate kinase
MAEKMSGKAFAAEIFFGEYLGEIGAQTVAFPSTLFIEAKVEKKKELEDVEIDNQITKEKFLKLTGKDKLESKFIDSLFGKEIDMPKKGYKLTINGTMTKETQGYESVLCVAIEKAVDQLSIENWKSDRVYNSAALALKEVGCTELKVHAAVSTLDSMVIIEETSAESKPKSLRAAKPLFFVVAKANSKVTPSDLRKKFDEKKTAKPKEISSAASDLKKIVTKLKDELKYGGNQEIGRLMAQNQAILSDLGITFPEVDQIIRIATFEGAFGAKLAGHAGNILILCEGDKQQDKIVASLLGKGYGATKLKVQ